ncbi:glutamate receptor ionotropic, delta-2-like [Periplaneta americana]|uniref:glutamate receptor ionotropic, delta-2-like n=1 Tax=Periplaneta americana TaxID=6978 RepID=UPI0037E81FE0
MSSRCYEVHNTVHLDTCVFNETGPTFIYNSSLFPQKVLNNLHNCIIKASTFMFVPYVRPSKEYISGKWDLSVLDGPEIQLMRLLVEYINASVELMRSPYGSEWGVQLKNGTWTGLRGELFHRGADLVFCDITSSVEDHINFDDTKSHMTTAFTWAVPCAKTFPRWSSITRVFTASTWVSAVLTLIVSAVVLKFLASTRKGPENLAYKYLMYCLLLLYSMALGGGAPSHPQRSVVRLLFMCWLIFSFAINTIFQTLMISYIVDPGLQNQIETEEELVNSDLNYAVNTYLEKYLNEDMMRKLSPRYDCKEEVGCRMLGANKTNLAAIGGRIIMAYQADNLTGELGKLCMLKEDVLVLHIVMLTSKGHPLLEIINKVVTRVTETGLLEHWIKDIGSERPRETNLVTLHNNLTYLPMSVTHLQAAFIFLCFGLNVSIFVFTGEFIYNFIRNKYKRN